MLNKIFNKIAALLIFIIVLFLTFTYLVIFPKITDFFYASEYQNIKSHLERLENIVNSEANKLQTLKSLSIQNSKESIVRVTQTAYDILESYYADYKLGIYSKEQAINEAFKTISKIRYGHKDDYIFVLDKKGTYFYHPNPALLQENMYYMTDVNGKYVTQNIIKSVEGAGEGFSSYMWPKANSSNSFEKHTYSKLFEPFGLIISAGIYMDNIDKEVALQKLVIQNSLNEIFSKFKLLENGFFYILKDKKVILNENKFYKSHYELNEQFFKRLKNASVKKEVVKNQYRGSTFLNWACYNKYFDWYVVASLDEEELIANAKELNNIILNVMIIMLMVMFMVGLYIANRMVVRPINLLSSNALKIRDGDFSLRNEVVSNDEIGILATQFNFMLDNLEENIKNLEMKVNLRTQELRHKLLYDELTGLKNRYSFLEHVKGERFATVILVDINAFDDINELYGYRIGNEVLTKFGAYLQELAKENYSEAYRIYGNAYAILYLSELFNFDDFEIFIHKIVDQIKKEPIYIEELHLEIYLDITLGIAICQEQPLKKANIALRKAKKSNRNFIVYNNEIDTKQVIENTIYWRNKIKNAITFDHIVPFFQPIVNKQGEIIKYEVLMRMEEHLEEEISYITPNKFLDIAMRTKQYIGISKAVLLKGLDSLNSTDKNISLNFSYTDINDFEFMSELEHRIERLDPKDCQRLVFEILESDSIANYDILKEFIQKYRALGVRIAIDDFGAGYSNFSHIMEVRPDFLKIDASLVKNIHLDQDAYELVKSIVVFSRTMGMRTIAEYVHCEEVFNLLLDLGIDEYQGYYFGPPQKEFK